MKKKFFCFTLMTLAITVFSQTVPQKYKIQSASYFIDGITREYPLKTEVKIDFEQVFYSEESLIRYINDFNSKLNNLRQLEAVTVRTVYLDPQDDYIPVVLLITTKDSWNIFGFPYPRYDSNTGLNLKIKLKDYNFLGTLKELNADVSYEFNEIGEHIIGGALSFSIPFEIKKVEASWNTSIGLYYAIGKYFSPRISTGLGFSAPLGPNSIDFGFTQGFNYDPKEYPGNSAYFTEDVYLNFPIQIAYIENWGKVKFVPGLTFNQNWGTDVFYGKWDGINHPDLKGPSAALSFAISTTRINWVQNYRDGASVSLTQSFSYNFGKNNFVPSLTFVGEYYKAFKYLSIVSRLVWFNYTNDTYKVGKYMRGIIDDSIETEGAFVLNFDLPIKLFATNWRKLGLPDWTKYFDFEMQAVPFFDAAITYDQGPLLDAGLEILIYPTKMRSIIGRVGIGFKLIPWTGFTSLFKSGNYELFIGIGLFY